MPHGPIVRDGDIDVQELVRLLQIIVTTDINPRFHEFRYILYQSTFSGYPTATSTDVMISTQTNHEYSVGERVLKHERKLMLCKYWLQGFPASGASCRSQADAAGEGRPAR